MAVCPGFESGSFFLWLSACVGAWFLVFLKFGLLITLKVGVFGVLTVPTGIYGLFLPNIISLLGLIRVNLDIKLIG